jgi:hypothetical protein
MTVTPKPPTKPPTRQPHPSVPGVVAKSPPPLTLAQRIYPNLPSSEPKGKP